MGAAITRLGILVVFVTSFAATAGAQPAPKPKPGEKPGEAPGWKPLEEEPETPEPPPPKPPPPRPDGSPYRPPAPTPTPDAPPPHADEPTQEVTENHDSDTLPESILWMKTWKPQFAVRQIRAEFDVWPNDAAKVFTWDLVFQLGVDDVPVFLDIVMPWTYVDFAGLVADDDGKLVGGNTHLGNPTFGLHGGGVAADVVGFWGGLWVSIPTVDDDLLGLNALTVASALAARNGIDAHRFFPQHVPLRWAFGVEGQLFPLIYLRTDIYSTLYLPTKSKEDDPRGFASSFGGSLEQISELEVLSPIGLGAGLRYQTLFGVTSSFDDGSIHSLEPYILYRPPYEGPYEFPLFARVGLLVGLNDPRGIGTGIDVQGGKTLTARSTIGYRF